MKTTKILYWVVTGLLAVLMTLSSIPDIIYDKQAIAMFEHLQLPTYLLPFLGIAKLLGVLAILVPRFPRLKEWAYAGLTFDLIGATYCMISVGDPISNWGMMFIGFALIAASYVLWHRVRRGRGAFVKSSQSQATPSAFGVAHA